MDFFDIKENEKTFKKGKRIEVYPDFLVKRSADLMVRGKSFHAIWNEKTGLWCTDEYEVAKLVDEALISYAEKCREKHPEDTVVVKTMSDYSSKTWVEFKNYISRVSDNAKELDKKIAFANTPVKKSDYISRKLHYPLEEGSVDAYEEIIGTLYSDEERKKLEWAIGAIISGDAKNIQKFIVLYGDAGAGKSTILNIVQKLFQGYYISFDAKALTNSTNAFSTEVFKSNPLVAIQHDGDLSRIEDNTKINSIVSHEEIIINEKYKSSYSIRSNCFLFMATNKPVKITDAKSGIIRRLIDVRPSGKKIPNKRYLMLMSQIDFELGAIAHHCLEVYQSMGKNYYSTYRPIDMMFKTDPFFNFVENYFDEFKEENGVSLRQAYSMYKEYCADSGSDYQMQRYKFREELKNYFSEFLDEYRLDNGQHIRSYYHGFLSSKFTSRTEAPSKDEFVDILDLDFRDSCVFDSECSDCPAQYANEDDKPMYAWSRASIRTLKDLDTTKVHYVRVPENHIVIDFDIKDSKGNKSYELNAEAASKWPATYAELSKGGSGIHLHYIYDGDVTRLSRIFDTDIEIKVFTGKSSLRRKLTKCNNKPINKLPAGYLPQKAEDKVVTGKTIKSDKSLHALITRCLNKEFGATKPSVDFIFSILTKMYESDVPYDVTDMRQAILTFAQNSTHNAEYCIKLVSKMPFKSEEPIQGVEPEEGKGTIIFFDVEVFPNLFVIVYKAAGKNPVKMINPTPSEVDALLDYKLVGFNNRRYDNHILYARCMGYTNEMLYNLSQKIVNGSRNAFFGAAYGLSYADIYDFSSKKQGLKKFEIELGIHHQELGLPWDQPVDESLWDKVADYCINDVVATEAVFNARQADFAARKILAELSGLTVNDPTRMHTTKIIFGNEKKPNLVYTDLSEMFPGYSFDAGKSIYRGEEVGEGGYVYAEPGMYTDVALLDIASMHPHSLIELNLFGEYTDKFKSLLDARLAIKHHDFEKLRGTPFEPYLGNESELKALAGALKIVINSVYGYTTATFDNPFRDPRNKDNIVAKRGALFMINLKHEVQERGFTVAHIKTDSIKIPNATPEIIDFVISYGEQYGYHFEFEAVYEKMCLVNDAVYIAKGKTGEDAGKWTATGAQFQQPYVFKTLFSKEPIEFKDMCETKMVSTALYLDMNEDLEEDEHQYHFVGKAGLFCPIKPGNGAGVLVREHEGKYYAATGTKGYRWMESEMVQSLGLENEIDRSYYISLVDDAVDSISKFGDFEWFVSDDTKGE